jgi:hypothetical protein
MPVPEFVLFLLTGRLLIWFIQTNGLMKPIKDLHPLIAELNECDLCLGFWVFLIMSATVKRKCSDTFPGWFGLVIQAAFSAFVTHLVRLGWHSKFGVTVI